MPGKVQGATIFLGDSITVGLEPFVQVDGPKRTVAKGGMSSDWLLLQAKSLAPLGYQNAIVLIGTNDIGAHEATWTTNNLRQIYDILREKGLRVYAMTVPPFKGYAWGPYGGDYVRVNARRQAINEWILGSGKPEKIVPLHTLLADPSDPERLSSKADSGDHVHPTKNAVAAAIHATLGGAEPLNPSLPPATPGKEPPKQSLAPETSMLPIVLGVLALGSLGAYIITRKR